MILSKAQAWGLGVALAVVAITTILHNPFGGYEHRDGLYARLEFVRILREAFPEYSDLSDSDLLAKTLTAHPAFRTWIREETDGSPPLAVAVRGQPTNYRLKPPPAYYGMLSGTYSRYAASTWIDEPAEYVGVVLPVILAAAVWLRLFRRRLSAVG